MLYFFIEKMKPGMHNVLLLLSRFSRVWLCETPIDGSPPGSTVPGILQARTLEWVAISFSNAWKWKVKVKSLSCVRLLATPWTAAYQGMELNQVSPSLGCLGFLHIAPGDLPPGPMPAVLTPDVGCSSPSPWTHTPVSSLSRWAHRSNKGTHTETEKVLAETWSRWFSGCSCCHH